MPANINPVFPVVGRVEVATLTSPTALTSRANITGTTGLTALLTTGSFGTRLDRIHINAKETTVAGVIFIWLYNGTTSFLFDEILVTAVTASTTAAAFQTYKDYTTVMLPFATDLYVSSTIDQDFNIVALGGDL